jgi:lipoteichoic acid synthase
MRIFGLVLLICTFFSAPAKATEQQILYHLPFGQEVYLVWGINGWQQPPNAPPGTIIRDGIMYSPMQKEGDDFVLRLEVPEEAVIDYSFWVTRGPLGLTLDYWDVNYAEDKPSQKDYHTRAGTGTVYIRPDLDAIKPASDPGLFDFAGYLLSGFLVLALMAGLWLRFSPRPAEPFNGFRLLRATAFALLLLHIPVRASAAGLIWPLLVSPADAAGLVMQAIYHDFIYIAVCCLIFYGLMHLAGRRKKAVLAVFLVWAFVSLMAGILNIKVVSLLGRPFNYQWLYYSDFLNSTDSKNAMNANMDASFLLSIAWVMAAALLAVWVCYRIGERIRSLRFATFTGCILCMYMLTGATTANDSRLTYGKLENPVVSFLSSVNPFASSPSLFTAKVEGESELALKSDGTLQPSYRKAFETGRIKNVLVFVLESTPAEYVQCYNSKVQAMPFLSSCADQAAVFSNVYAHSPATNNSMVSLLCSMYPRLSYTTITAEKPDLAQPSISSVLSSEGYRTAFFNSGDNRFQNAEGFLKNRSMDVVTDFRDQTCSEGLFLTGNKDWKNLDGQDDRCLAEKCLSWIKKDTARPFFATLWTFQTHYPYFASGPEKDYGTRDKSLNRYLNALNTADQALEKLVRGLKEEGLYESTLLVVLGDHGEAFGRHNQTTHASNIYEENLHIPLLFINPRLFKGERISDVGGISDVAPSILSVLGKPAPGAWVGESLFAVSRRKKVYFFAPWSQYWFGYREGRYKYLYNASSNTSELYDLERDPFEEVNLAPVMPERVEKGQGELARWVQYQERFTKRLFAAAK